MSEGHGSLRIVLAGGSGALTVSHTLLALRVHKTGVMQSDWPGLRVFATKVNPLTYSFLSRPRRVECVRRSLVRCVAQGFSERASPECVVLAHARHVGALFRARLSGRYDASEVYCRAAAIFGHVGP